MGRHPKLSELQPLFGDKADVILSGSEYARRTGASLPKSKGYLVNGSAFAKWLREQGYVIVDVEAVIEKTVHIKNWRTVKNEKDIIHCLGTDHVPESVCLR